MRTKNKSQSEHSETKESPAPATPQLLRLEVEQTTDYDRFKNAPMPFLPSPLMGERFKALKLSIEKAGGLQTPIQVDKDNRVWDGRSRLKACSQLGLPVSFVVIPDQRKGFEVALDGALHREWTVLEQAGFVAYVYDHKDELEITATKDQKTRDAVGAWLGSRLGWKRCTSGFNIDKFRKLSKAYDELVDSEVQKQIEGADSLHAALGFLPDNRELKVSDADAQTDIRKKVLKEVLDRCTFEATGEPDEELLDLIGKVRVILDKMACVPQAA